MNAKREWRRVDVWGRKQMGEERLEAKGEEWGKGREMPPGSIRGGLRELFSFSSFLSTPPSSPPSPPHLSLSLFYTVSTNQYTIAVRLQRNILMASLYTIPSFCSNLFPKFHQFHTPILSTSIHPSIQSPSISQLLPTFWTINNASYCSVCPH